MLIWPGAVLGLALMVTIGTRCFSFSGFLVFVFFLAFSMVLGFPKNSFLNRASACSSLGCDALLHWSPAMRWRGVRRESIL